MECPIREAVARLRRDRRGLTLVEGERVCAAPELADLLDREVASLGALPSGPVFTHVGNRVELLMRFFALLAVGARPVVLPARVPEGELRALLEAFAAIPLDAGPRGFVDGDGRPRPLRAVDEDYTMVLPTSGSTGKPRLIVGAGENIQRCVRGIERSQGIADCGSTGAVLPAHFSYCLVNQVLWSLLRGARLVLTPGVALPGPALETLGRERVEFVCFVAQQVRILVRLGFAAEEYVMPSVRVVNFAGGPFAFDCWDALTYLFPNARFNNNYGCTEAFPRVSARHVQCGDDPISSVGRPIDGLDVWICDDDGRPFPRDKVGRIWCKGTTTGVGELRPDGSVQPFSDDGSFPSGDYGLLTEEGDLHVYGRADQIINVGGERVSLLKIESVLRLCPGVEDAIATGVREENGEQWPLVCVNGRTPPEREALRAHFTKHLSRAAWPRKLYHLREWPMLPSDKPDRRRVLELAKDGALPLIWEL